MRTIYRTQSHADYFVFGATYPFKAVSENVTGLKKINTLMIVTYVTQTIASPINVQNSDFSRRKTTLLVTE